MSSDPTIIELAETLTVLYIGGLKVRVELETGRVVSMAPRMPHVQREPAADPAWLELTSRGYWATPALVALIELARSQHPADCYPCKGTGSVIGFGAAHGGPCPADPIAEG